MIKTYQGIISKSEFIAELEKHQAADNFLQNHGYWKNGKGCAVGCSLQSIEKLKKINIRCNDHSQYPELLGMPEWLAHLEDKIFEGMSEKRSKKWPLEFAKAIPENVELEQVKSKFLIFILEHTLTKFDHIKFPDVKKCIDDTVNLWKTNSCQEEFKAAEAAAWAAAWAAAGAARTAAEAAWAAARTAAWALEESDACAVAATAEMSASVEAAWAPWSTGEEKTYEYFADQLLIMLREI